MSQGEPGGEVAGKGNEYSFCVLVPRGRSPLTKWCLVPMFDLVLRSDKVDFICISGPVLIFNFW